MRIMPLPIARVPAGGRWAFNEMLARVAIRVVTGGM